MTRGEMGTKVMGAGVTVVSSPFLTPLTDALADRLAVSPSDPFASELIVVPNIGVRDWLQRELSTRLDRGAVGGRAGIVANVRFMFVQQFLDTVFTASGTSSVADWDIEHLTWVVHRAIDAVGRPTVPGAATKPLTVARVLADLFDRYGVHRPSMLRYWRNGRAVDGVEPLMDLPDHLRWQQRLFAEVCRQMGTDGPADRLAGLEAVIREQGISELVPERLAVFGFVTVNSTVRAVIEALGLARECHVFVVHPAPGHRSTQPTGRDHLEPRDHHAVDVAGNPLVARWGRPALETPQVLRATWQHLDVNEDVRHDLDRLRRSIIEDRPLRLVPIAQTGDVLDCSDGSIQIHSCHGKVRQVEVLRDALLHLLADDPTLMLGDISVQCPDLDAFAPIIPAVFRSGQTMLQGAPPPLDVSIADRAMVGENPYLDAFWTLCASAESRCGVGEMLTLLTASPIRQRFDVDEGVLSRVADWVESLNVKFGLDTEHRHRWDLPSSIDVGTWDAALDRLYMGLALPAEVPFEGPGGIVPHDDVSVTDAPVLARITDFLTLFRRLVDRVESVQTVREWADIFASIIDTFFDESETRDFYCRDLLDAIDRMVGAAHRADAADGDQFAFDEISAILEDLISTSSVRPRFRTGAITVTELLPQQGVPYRVIALLGVDENMFTTGGARGDDVMSLRPCVGDPMPSSSGRLQLLNVVLSAHDAVIVTCDGADITNNKPIPLPVPLQELLECVAAVRADAPRTGTVKVFTKHPRQSFATRALIPGPFRSDRPFTFDPISLHLHERRSQPPAPVLADRHSPSSAASTRVEIDALRRVVAKPADFFVNDVLGLRLPSADVGAGSDFVEVWPSNLDVSRSGRELLAGLLRTKSDPVEAIEPLVRQMMVGGSFPPGRLGDLAAAQVSSEVLSMFDLLPESVRQGANYRSLEIDDLSVPASSGAGEFVVTGSIDDVMGHELVRASFTRFREDLLLAPWIDLALATCLEPEHPWSVRLVARGSKGEATARQFTLVGSDAGQRQASAVKVIDVARTLMECMSRGRVPYLPRTADKLARASVEASRSTYDDEFEYSIPTQFLFARVTWEEFVGEQVQPEDPHGDTPSRARRFAQFVWDTWRETTMPVGVDASRGAAEDGDEP